MSRPTVSTIKACWGPLALTVTMLGCGEATRPASQSDAGAAPTPVVAKTDEQPELQPELQIVPSNEPKAPPASARAKEAFANLIKAAESGEAEDWTKAESELHELGLSAVPALAEGLEESNSVARELAAMFLAQLGPDASPAAKGLLKLLDDPSAFARVNAAAALSTFEGHGEAITPVLTSLLSDDDVNVRITAATSLRNVGPAGREAVAGLKRLLEDTDARVRAAAATTLGELGTHATSTLATLKTLRDDEDEQVRSAVTRAINLIDETKRNSSATIPASATE